MVQNPTAPAGRDRQSSRALRWWWAAGAFVVGVFVGAVLVGLLSEGSPTSAATAPTPSAPSAPSAAAGQSPASSPSPGIVDPTVSVNDACLRAVNAAQDAYAAISDVGDAARGLNAARLDEIVRQLQPLQAQLRDNVAACRVVTTLPDGSSVVTTPSPPALPSPSPSRG